MLSFCIGCLIGGLLGFLMCGLLCVSRGKEEDE